MHHNETVYNFLQNHEEQYKKLVESIKDYAIFMLDIYGNIMTWNKGAERIKGYIEPEILGQHFSIFYTKEDIDRKYPEEELKIAKAEGRFEDEGWRVRKDKSLFWANVIITPVYDNDQLIGFSKITRDLTEKRKSEEALKELQQSYKLLIEGIETVKDYAIIILDENGYITRWNSGAERIKGYKPKEIIGRHFSQFYPKNAVEAGYPEYELEKAIKEGRFEDEGWRVKKDGSLFWANVIITPIVQNDKIVGFTKVTRDLTEKVINERKLRETEDKHKLLLNSINDYAIFMLDEEGHITSWNKGAEYVIGYKPEEIIGKHFSKFYTKKLVDENFPQYELEQAKEHGRFEDQGWRVKKDGSIFWANVIITPIVKDGKLIGFSKVTRDLTEQKKIEKALKESEERYRMLVEGVKDYGIFMLDPYGYITTWNKGAEQISGYTAEEIVGKHFSIFFDSDSVASGQPNYELLKAKETGRFEQEGWRLRKDGSKYWANVIVSSIKTDNDRLLGYAKIVRDLTLIKEAESDLLKKNAELSRLNNELDSFIYTASHDLKAPISNIEGLLTSLVKALPDNFDNQQTIKKIIGYIDTSVKRFKRTILDLTEITKLQKNYQEDPSDISVKEVFEDVKDSVAPLINSSNAKLKYVNPNGDIIRISQASLRSVLYNLISNALKYRHPDRDPEVTLTFTSEGDYNIIKVSDNGLGIPLAFQKNIFAMFKRFHDHVEGTGVGLFIVKRVVDSLEGKITVDSTPGVGTAITIYFKM